MIPTPIHTALATLREHDVQCLLTGGQACVLYGGAEFSRDLDVATFAADSNLEKLRSALAALKAEVEYVPPFEAEYLRRGHAVHFRCHRQDVGSLRLDVMTKMRGVDPFPALWERRTTLEVVGVGSVDMLSLPDLVASKKTRRAKDWPMVQRLIEASYEQFGDEPTAARVRFWLLEARTPELLLECAGRFADAAEMLAPNREAITPAIERDASGIRVALAAEQARIEAEDEAYWAPLLRELEGLRHREARKGRGRRSP